MNRIQNIKLKMIFSELDLANGKVQELISKQTTSSYADCNKLQHQIRYYDWQAISDYLERKMKAKVINLSNDIKVEVNRTDAISYVKKWNNATDIVFCDCFYILATGEVIDMCDYLFLLLDKDKSEVLNFKFTSAYELEE